VDQTSPLAERAPSFFSALKTQLPDLRDRRGLRHNLAFVLTAVVLAQLSGFKTLSDIQRFIERRLRWLRRLTGEYSAGCPSRSQLPLIIESVDKLTLNILVLRHFAERAKGWVAADGKVMRGASSDGRREAIVIAVSHEDSIEVARAAQVGEKESEIVVMRELLRDSGLEAAQVTTDALHCNETTLKQVAAAGGEYLTQVKDNQPELSLHCAHLVRCEPPLADYCRTDKGHGRVTETAAHLLPLRAHLIDRRWRGAQLKYLVAVTRQTLNIKTQELSCETAFYVTNAARDAASHTAHLVDLMGAIRGHWAVEANNYVRDVTLGEDAQITRSSNIAQTMAILRGAALSVLRRAGRNCRAALTDFCLMPANLARCLRAEGVL